MSVAAEERMSRDYRKLRTYAESDALVLAVYDITRLFPPDERFGMRMQLRRAAVSVTANIAEGSTRSTTADYCRFLELAMGSSRECACLLELAGKLGFADCDTATQLSNRYDTLCRSWAAMINALRSITPPGP
jgi:four helix bundle protein